MIRYAFLALVLFGNLWIFKIFQQNFFWGLTALLCSVSLFLSFGKRAKINTLFFGLLFLLLLVFQWQGTQKISLVNLTNDEKRIQDMRLEEYPNYKISLFDKDIWIPLAYWFEGRKESLIFYKMKKNFSEVVDINLYFFANHPRERVGIRELEKFPFILLPLFIFGLFVFTKKNKILSSISLAAPIVLITLIGGRSILGPFSILPGIVVATTIGLESFFEKLRKISAKKRILSFFVLVILFCINFAQMYFYDKF